MARYSLFYFMMAFSQQILAQDTIRHDSINTIKETVIIYQADKLTPVTFQNIGLHDLKATYIGQEPSFLFSQTPSITNYSDGGNSQGYSSAILIMGIDVWQVRN